MIRIFFALSMLLTAALAFGQPAPSGSTAKKYEANWDSLNARPTPKWYTDAKFGIFIHWGVYSVPSWSVRGEYSEWYWAHIRGQGDGDRPWRDFHAKNYGKDFDYRDFAPMFRAELFDPDFWAKTFAESGAKYVVLTSKHHDGFCLWPSQEANRSWGRPWNSVDAGPKRDLLGDLAQAVRKRDLKMGFYYSLYEWFNPLWLKDRPRYVAEHMRPQFKDVVSRYRPSIIFSDGEWDLPSSEWKSPELLAWLFNESPCREEVVVNDRWGKDERHKNGGYWTTEYGAGLPDASHPWEENRGMAHSFGYSRTEQLEDYRTGHELVWMLADLVSRGGNLLLDIGPTADGRIPVVMQDRLAEIGRWLKVNGEAIYGTKPWKQTCQWSDGEKPKQSFGQDMQKYDVMKLAGMTPVGGKARKQAFFTWKDGTLYAILPGWPGKTFTLRGVQPGEKTRVEMLGLPGALRFHAASGNLVIEMPEIAVDQLPCQHAWTLKVSGVER
jgi:alpha-L-fucosidase